MQGYTQFDNEKGTPDSKHAKDLSILPVADSGEEAVSASSDVEAKGKPDATIVSANNTEAVTQVTIASKNGAGDTKNDQVNGAESLQPAPPDTTKQGCWDSFGRRGILAYFVRMRKTFGIRYLIMIFLGGGFSKGVADSMVTFAAQYLYTDQPPDGFGLTASRVAAITSLVHTPWVIKSLYGIVSDTTPILGMHRTPYIVIGGIVGVMAFAALIVMPAASAVLACLGLAAVEFSFALTDVMIDTALADATRRNPSNATDLQVLTMGSFGICSMVASLVKGEILDLAGTRSLFAIGMFASAVVVPPAILGWLGESRVPEAQNRCTLHLALKETHAGSDIFKLALVLCALAVSLATTSVWLESTPWVPPLLSVPVGAFVCAACWHYEYRVSKTLALASMYAFLQNAFQPNLIVMFKWYKKTEENCNPIEPIPGLHPLPCFSPQFVGDLDVAARFAFLAALGLYNRYLSSWRYRSIFAAAQLALIAVNLLDLIWVCRLNLIVGLPDELFAIGTELLQPMVDRFSLIPLFVLVAKLCPVEAQGTAFALNMGLLWLGRNVGGYLGMGLLALLGGVEPPEFENIRWLVTLRSLTRALPLIIIPVLLPRGSPQEDAHHMEANKKVEQLKEAIAESQVVPPNVH